MKYLHWTIAFFYILYTSVHLSRLGIGEWASLLIFSCALLIARLVFKKNLTGMFLAGMILGAAVEFITEVYWDYHLNVYIWKDISLFVILGWGYSFSFFVLISNFVNRMMNSSKIIPPSNIRILLCDAALAPIWFIPNELIAMKVLHLWDYSAVSGFTQLIPWINYPLEAVIGSVALGMVMPTFIRHWEYELRFK